MAIMKIDKPDWQAYFDRMAKTLEGKSAEIDVEALEIGSLVEAEWVPLLGISYDPYDDVLAVVVEGLDHMVRQPQSLFVDVELGQMSSMEVVGGDGYRHIVKLRDPLRLPPH